MIIMNNIAVFPIIPKLLVEFAGTPNSRVLAPMAAAMPILGIAFSSIIAGALGERIGRRRLLEISTAVFAVVAILPFWLHSLALILFARAASGIALGAMATSGVGLTGDYFSGAARQRWFAIQGGISSAAGVVTSVIAGALSDINWRLPFLMLSVAFIYVLALLLLPARHSTRPTAQHQDEAVERGASGPIPWRSLAAIFSFTLFGSLIIFPPLFELGLVFQEKRLGSGTLTGIANAVIAAGAVVGALGSSGVRRLSGPVKMAMVFAAGGLGTLLISASDHIPPILIGAAVVGIGQGAMTPILQGWLLDRAPARVRGRCVGLFNTTLFLSWFVTPLLASWIAVRSANTSSSMVYYEFASVAAIALILLLSIRQPWVVRPAS